MAGKIAAILTASLIFVVVPVMKPEGPVETGSEADASADVRLETAAGGWRTAAADDVS